MRRLLWSTFALLASSLWVGVQPLLAAPVVSVTMTSSPNLVLDSNSPGCTQGPRAAYVAYRITNTGATATLPLTATIAGFASGIALTGSQPAAQSIGSLAVGASRTVFWFIEYPCTFGVASTLTVSVSDGTAGASTGSGTVTTRSMISANAGGNLVSQVINGGAVVGALVSIDITYSFGGVSAGDTYNFQVAGTKFNTSAFNARCFQLVGTLVTASAAPAVPVGATDRTYFAATANQGGANINVTMRYTFKVGCANVSTIAYPYSDQQSGSSNLKYSSNFDTYPGAAPPANATVSVTVAATVTPTLLSDGGTTTYTATFTNTAAVAVALDSIRVTLPAGVTYGALTGTSGVTAATSSSVPATGATGTIVFRAIPFTSYTIAASGTLTLVFTQTIPAAEGTYTTTTIGYLGYEPTNTASASVVVRRQANLAAAKSGPLTAAVGDTLRYVLTVTNAGPSAATNVVVVDTLPSGVTFVTASRSATLSGAVVTWPALASLANGGTQSDTVRVIVTTPGSITNRAAATSAANDSFPANNNGSSAAGRVVTTVTGYAVTTTPDGATTSRLPSNGVQYTDVFTVLNGGSGSDTYTLTATATPSGILTIVSVNGTTGTTGAVTLAAGASGAINVVYTVNAGAATGATALLQLTATSQSNPPTSDAGTSTATVLRAGLTLSKTPYRDNQSTILTGADRVLPNQAIQFRIQVTNTGTAPAANVVVTDALPSDLQFVSTTGDLVGWTLAQSAGTVTGTLATPLAVGASRFFWIRATVR